MAVRVADAGYRLEQGNDTGVRGQKRWRLRLVPEVIPDTVGQFTGLLDACGNEIYEGDILREQGTGKLVQVVYDAPEFVFKSNQFGYVFLNHPENFEVAGNAYDNPELLKGGRE